MDKFDERTEAVLDRANRYLLIGHPNEKTVLRLIIASALRDAFSKGMEQGRREEREACAEKLDAAAKHQAEQDKHPAWDRSRVDCEPCFEPGHHKYHSYLGFSAHVVEQMAKVIRARSTQESTGIPGEEKEGVE